jgi:acetyltransferase EpsM
MAGSKKHADSMKKRLLIYGGGGHALVVKDILEETGEVDIAAIVVDPLFVGSVKREFDAIPTYSAADLVTLKGGGVDHAIVAIGLNRDRMRIGAELRHMGFCLLSAIHPEASIARSSQIGSGTVIAAGAVVGAHASIGQDVIINTCASVDHECEVEDGCHVCPGARLAGAVRLREGSTVGIGAAVIERLEIGRHTMIGAGSVVVRDVPERVVAFGTPARVVRSIDGIASGGPA